MKFGYMPLLFHFHCAFYIPGNVQHICVAMTFIYQSWRQFGYTVTKLTKINTTFYKNALPPWNLIKRTMYKIFKNICYRFLNSMTQKYIYRHIHFFLFWRISCSDIISTPQAICPQSFRNITNITVLSRVLVHSLGFLSSGK